MDILLAIFQIAQVQDFYDFHLKQVFDGPACQDYLIYILWKLIFLQSWNHLYVLSL